MRNPILGISLALAALALGLGAWSWQQWSRTAHPQLEAGTLLDMPRALPDFTLRDQNAAAFGKARLNGHWNLLFFGFTHCPDICPNTLGLLRQVKQSVNDPRLQIVFISLDPSRDDSARLSEYIGYFDPSFLAATGAESELQKLSAALYLPYALTAPDENGNYSVDHSASLILVSPAAYAVAYFSTPHQAAALSHDMKTLMNR